MLKTIFIFRIWIPLLHSYVATTAAGMVQAVAESLLVPICSSLEQELETRMRTQAVDLSLLDIPMHE